MNYGRVPGVDKPVARVVQGTMMIGSDEEEERSFALLDGLFALVGSNAGEQFRANAAACHVRLTPEELAWLENGGGDRPSSA